MEVGEEGDHIYTYRYLLYTSGGVMYFALTRICHVDVDVDRFFFSFFFFIALFSALEQTQWARM